MTETPVDGLLNINKSTGMTSMAVVRRIKSLTRQGRVGHGGTLDPAASGVLPIFLGQATRAMEYLVNGTKSYSLVVYLGVSTDTYDSLGNVTDTRDPSHITLEDVERALDSFNGIIYQVPPMYSALKQKGQRLYDLARSGVEVEREPRKVEVSQIRLLEWSTPTISLEVECGRGAYMRSLAHDLGTTLGCGAHLKSLVRVRTGPFHLDDALSLAQAEEAIQSGGWKELLWPVDTLFLNLRAAILNPRDEALIRNGQYLPRGVRIPSSKPYEECRVYNTQGRFFAIICFDASKSQWVPKKVFAPTPA